jgi:hypothetical protein
VTRARARALSCSFFSAEKREFMLAALERYASLPDHDLKVLASTESAAQELRKYRSNVGGVALVVVVVVCWWWWWKWSNVGGVVVVMMMPEVGVVALSFTLCCHCRLEDTLGPLPYAPPSR